MSSIGVETEEEDGRTRLAADADDADAGMTFAKRFHQSIARARGSLSEKEGWKEREREREREGRMRE